LKELLQQQQHPVASIFMDAAIEQDVHQISWSLINNEERLPDFTIKYKATISKY
jgi:hypothetical protein